MCLRNIFLLINLNIALLIWAISHSLCSGHKVVDFAKFLQRLLRPSFTRRLKTNHHALQKKKKKKIMYMYTKLKIANALNISDHTSFSFSINGYFDMLNPIHP